MIWKEWKLYKGSRMMKEMMEASMKARDWRSVQWPDEKYSKDKKFVEAYEILKKVHDRINVC